LFLNISIFLLLDSLTGVQRYTNASVNNVEAGAGARAAARTEAMAVPGAEDGCPKKLINQLVLMLHTFLGLDFRTMVS
jgi:hypothetical protein